MASAGSKQQSGLQRMNSSPSVVSKPIFRLFGKFKLQQYANVSGTPQILMNNSY